MKKKFDASMITALAAGVVSLSALTVSIYEAYLQRQEQRVSVWPIVEHWTAYDPASFGINIANKGIGPAIIEHVEVAYDGVVMNSWGEVFDRELGENANRYNQSMLIGNVMAPGDRGEILLYRGDSVATAAWRASQKVTMSVCYCSVFGDCWVYRVKDLVAGRATRSAVEHCPAGAEVAF